jgi:hypothetical protein
MTQGTELEGYPSVALNGLPKLDRFFPDCALGLVELVARKALGVPDIKQIWFGNTFDYRPPIAPEWLSASRVEFAGTFFVTDDVRPRALRYLERCYGFTVSPRQFVDLGALLDEIHGSLQRGVPAISMFDMSFLQEPERRSGKLRPHMIAVAGWDEAAHSLTIVDQVKGQIAIPRKQLEDSFHRFADAGHEFFILECRRGAQAEVSALGREQTLEDIRRAVVNLRSTEPNLGLNALRRLGADANTALEVEKRPFAIPGQWIFSHDRHAVRSGLRYWKEAGVASPAVLGRLDRLLGEAFGAWFQMDMTIERAIMEKSVSRMREALAALDVVVPIEVALADALEAIASEAARGAAHVSN